MPETTETTTAAAAPPPAIEPPPTTTTPAVAPWIAELTPEQRGVVELKKYKTIGDVVNGYSNAQKLIGGPPEEYVRIGKDGTAQEVASGILDRIGAPKTPEEYGIVAPEGGDPELATAFSTWAHELKLLPWQAKGLLEKFNGTMAGRLEEGTASSEQAKHAATLALKAEWGMDYQRRFNVAENATAQLGIKPEELDAMAGAMGHAGLVKFVYGLASRLGVDKFVTGSLGATGGFTPDAARARKAEMLADGDFKQRFITNALTTKEREEWSRIHQAMHPTPEGA